MTLLRRLIDSLNEERVRFTLVGGYAVALHGAIRGTVDIDLVLSFKEQQFVACEKALNRAGLVSRLPVRASEVFKFRKEYLEKRNLIAWSFFNPDNPIEVVDIILTHNLDQIRSVNKKMGTLKIPVISIDDLISMKQESARRQDLEDVKMLKRLKNEK